MLSEHDPARVWSFLNSRYGVQKYHGSFQLLATKHLPKNCRITFRAAMAVSPTNKQGKPTYYFEVRVNWDKLMAIDQHPSFALVFCMLFSLSKFRNPLNVIFNCLGDIGCVNLVSRVKHISFAGWKQILVGGQPSILKKNIVAHDVFFPPHHVQLSIVFLQFDPPTYACWFMLTHSTTSRYIYTSNIF